MKRLFTFITLLYALTVGSRALAQVAYVGHSHIRTCRVVANGDVFAPPVIKLDEGEQIELSFDELSHQYHRYQYTLTHCNADWTPSSLPENEYLEGFNDNPIEDYAVSFNTTMPYTHYRLTLPNEDVRLKLSGNYLVNVYDTDADDPTLPVLTTGFSVLDPQVSVSAQVSTNTDIDHNLSHQQVSFSIAHRGYTIRNPQTELKPVVRQNNRMDNQVSDLRPSYISTDCITYEHNHALIFKAGNEYRRFETVSTRYLPLGVEDLRLHDPYYHATLYTAQPRTANYIYDQDQDGHYLIRYDQAQDQDTEADYFFVHFSLSCPEPLTGGDLYLQGAFTGGRFDESTRLSYDPATRTYQTVQLLKQGAYNYLYLFLPDGSDRGSTTQVEGDFHQTENEYLILIYHRPFGLRYDKLIGMQRVKYEP